MTEGNKAVLSAVFAGGFLWWMVNQYNKPKLTYQWLNGQLVFNLTKGSKGVNGTINVMGQSFWETVNSFAPINNNISWQGDTAFSVIPQADSVFFQVQQGDKIIFTQTVNKEA